MKSIIKLYYTLKGILDKEKNILVKVRRISKGKIKKYRQDLVNKR